MKCPTETPENTEFLLAYSSGKLDGAQAAAFAEHATECRGCGGLVAAQETLSQSLDLWEAPAVSPDFDRRLYSRIEKEVSWWELLLRPFRPVMIHRAVPVAAAAGLLVAAGLWIEQPGRSPSIAIPQSAQVEALPPEQAEHALQEMDMMQEFSRILHNDSSDPRI